MPKNGKKRKRKNKKVHESPEERKKKEMINKIKELKDKIVKEKKFCNKFTLEKESYHKNLVLLQNSNKDKKFDIIIKEREIQDLLERNELIIENYREKVKQFLYQKQDDHCERRFNMEYNLNILEEKNKELENQLLIDNRGVKKENKEQKLAQFNFLFNLKLDSDHQSTNIRAEFERQYNEMKIKYDLKIQKLRKHMEEYSEQVIRDLEEKKEKKIKQITDINNEKYREIKNYYNDIISSNLSLIKHLKGEITRAQTIEEQDKKQLLRGEELFKRLNEPIKQKTEEIKKLEQDKKHWKIIKEEKNKLRNQISDLEKEFRDIEYQYEIKFQQFQYLDDEFQKLNNNYNDKVYDIYQKSGLKNLILEKELKMLGDSIEKSNLQIQNLLLNTNIEEEDKENLREDVDKVVFKKDEEIKDLKMEILEVRKAHLQMVNAFNSKLRENHIPLDELGFQPILPDVDNLDLNEVN